MNTIDHEQMPSILLDKIYLYTIYLVTYNILMCYILSISQILSIYNLSFIARSLLLYYSLLPPIYSIITHVIYITIYSSLLLSNIHKYIHIYTLTKPLFLLSTTKLTIPILILHFIYTFTTTIALPILLPLLSFTLITITKAYTQLSLTYSQLYKYTTTHIFIIAYSNTYSYYIRILLFVLFIIFRYTNIIHLHTTLKQVNGKPYNSYL